MNTMTKIKGVDLDAWREGRVPPDVKQCIIFIYLCSQAKRGPSWAAIAQFMDWKCPRPEIRPKLKRMRRWGVRWDLNKPGSTRIDKRVWPFIEAELDKARLVS